MSQSEFLALVALTSYLDENAVVQEVVLIEVETSLLAEELLVERLDLAN